MISKQTGRILCRGRDHKDVFFNGKYYPVMAAKNEYGCDGVIWRKLFPDKYYMTRSAQWWNGAQRSVNSLGIYYNELDTYREESRFLEDCTTVVGARFIALAENAYKSLYGYTVSPLCIYLSVDGKYYKKFGLDHVICAGPFFVPEGFIYVYNDGVNYHSGTSYFYHVRVDDDMNRIGEETLLFSLADGENNFHKGNLVRCPHIGEDPDVLLYYYNDLYVITMDGNCKKADVTCQHMNASWMSYQNGRFILPMYAYAGSVTMSYLGESSDGMNWKKHIFPDTVVSGSIAVLWDGAEYICYADCYYDSDHYCLKIYSGRSLAGLSLVNSMQGDGYPIALVLSDKSLSGSVTMVFDSKYTESYYVRHDGIYRINAQTMFSFLTSTVCFKDYKRSIPHEVLIGSTNLNKYQIYSYYWTVYMDNLYLQQSDKNFMCSNYSPGTGSGLREWGIDMAEYYARRQTR